MTGYRQTGDLRLARTEDETDVILNLVHSQAAKGLQIELLDIRHAQQIVPALSNEFLLATGVQTNLLLKGLGVYIPMKTPLVFAFQAVPLTNLLVPVIGVANGDLAVRQQIDGRLRFTRWRGTS